MTLDQILADHTDRVFQNVFDEYLDGHITDDPREEMLDRDDVLLYIDVCLDDQTCKFTTIVYQLLLTDEGWYKWTDFVNEKFNDMEYEAYEAQLRVIENNTAAMNRTGIFDF